MRKCWFYPHAFIIGHHTRIIANRIDRAISDFGRGKSTYLVIMVPFRHGKSDCVSRFLPPRFLGLFPECEVMLTTYGADLSEDLSRICRNVVRSPDYEEIFPDIAISKESSAVNIWGVQNHIGKMYATGIRGPMPGKGYHLGIVDDYCKSREEAESDTIRNKTWEGFTDGFLTRKAPVSITIVMATPWHEDDLIGRIKQKMIKDPEFPRFEIICFPAKSEEYETGYLFPERYPPNWYEENFATLGTYSSAALLQCNPISKGGALLKTNKIQYTRKMPSGLRWVRAWDLASSEKERMKDDPDYTVGVRLAVQQMDTAYEDIKYYIVFIDDVIRGRWEAPKRNRIIRDTAMKDGPRVQIAIEAVAGYKDAYTELKTVLKGIRTVRKITTTTDLVSRTSEMEAIFEAGNIHLLRADWNDDFIREISKFTGKSSMHDDQVAAMVTGFEAAKKDNLAKSLWEE